MLKPMDKLLFATVEIPRNAHLEEIDRQANEMMERLNTQIAQREGVTEALRARDQMAWIRAMNSIKNRAEEIVLHDLSYT